jgi:hypothetical protein
MKIECQFIKLVFMACFFISLLSDVALADPISIGIDGFSSSATVVNFNSIGNEVAINSQYAGQGVIFSGALFGLDDSFSGDNAFYPDNGGGVIAPSWLYSKGKKQGLSFEANFL